MDRALRQRWSPHALKALALQHNKKNKAYVGVKAKVVMLLRSPKAARKENMITFNMNEETICLEVETKPNFCATVFNETCSSRYQKGIIAGGIKNRPIALTWRKRTPLLNLLGSTNKSNILGLRCFEGLHVASSNKMEYYYRKVKTSKGEGTKYNDLPC